MMWCQFRTVLKKLGQGLHVHRSYVPIVFRLVEVNEKLSLSSLLAWLVSDQFFFVMWWLRFAPSTLSFGVSG